MSKVNQTGETAWVRPGTWLASCILCLSLIGTGPAGAQTTTDPPAGTEATGAAEVPPAPATQQAPAATSTPAPPTPQDAPPDTSLTLEQRQQAAVQQFLTTVALTKNNLGAVYFEQGQYDSAQVHLEHALEIAPGFAAAYLTMGWYTTPGGIRPRRLMRS